jgi:hypothetical protein
MLQQDGRYTCLSNRNPLEYSPFKPYMKGIVAYGAAFAPGKPARRT